MVIYSHLYFRNENMFSKNWEKESNDDDNNTSVSKNFVVEWIKFCLKKLINVKSAFGLVYKFFPSYHFFKTLFPKHNYIFMYLQLIGHSNF